MPVSSEEGSVLHVPCGAISSGSAKISDLLESVAEGDVLQR